MKNLNVKTGSNQWTAHKSRQNYNQNFLQSLTKGIHGAMRQILKKENGPQGSDIVHKFLPLGAILEAPLYPYHSPKIQFADMDGDKAAELIATYRINGTLTTLILKNTEGEWRKVCEYTHPNCEVFNFRELADLTGEGRQHILMGLKSGTDAAVLYGYSLEEDRLQTLFTRNYHGLELMKGYSRKKGSARAQIAFWDHVENSAYDVHVCRYDGLQLSDIKNSSWYYQRRVLPYYSSRIRQSPQDPIHWFNLARILKTTGNIEASNLVIEEGMRVAKDFTMQQRFITLKRQGSQL